MGVKECTKPIYFWNIFGYEIVSENSIKTHGRLKDNIPGFQRKGTVVSHFYLQV